MSAIRSDARFRASHCELSDSRAEGKLAKEYHKEYHNLDQAPVYIAGIGLIGTCGGCNRILRVSHCQIGASIGARAHLCERCVRRLRAKSVHVSKVKDTNSDQASSFTNSSHERTQARHERQHERRHRGRDARLGARRQAQP